MDVLYFNNFFCLAHGNWNSWVEGTCSTNCGNGTRTRYRHCDNPSPANGGLLCSNQYGQNQTIYESVNVTCVNACCPSMLNSFLSLIIIKWL